MKKYLIICILAIGIIPLYLKAQEDESTTNPDSIKSRIIEILKLKNLTFYYFNLALLSAHTGNYLYAIINMKKNLLLVPEAKDARAAQDKIYEWELKMEK